jgi:hypothetical protein
MTTAQDYATRYKQAFETGTLTQGEFHIERDGRQLACALGVIGPDINDAGDCPAQIMPRWLAQMVPAFFDKQKQDAAFLWGLEFTAELARLNGNVPFSVVHDWHANVVCPLGIEAAKKRGSDPSPHKALQALHLRALAGEKISADDWQPVLKCAYANAYANADANAYSYAYANAYAYAYAYAYADADADADAYAYAYAYAYASAYADAYAYAYADADAYVWNKLAVGMTECLKRVPTPKEEQL